MTQKIEIGALSLTGISANAQVAAEFSGAAYPIKVRFTNLMPLDTVFPEINGLSMKNKTDETGRSAEVEIPSYDAFQRLASSLGQVAELNGYAEAFVAEEVPAPTPALTPAPTPDPTPAP